MKRSIIIAAVGMAFASPAWAACPVGEQAYYTSSGGPNPTAVEHCTKVDDEGGDVAWTGNLSRHLSPVMHDHDGNPATPNQQLVIGGKPIVSPDSGANDDGPHQHSEPFVIGMDGVAVGDGSKVGEREWVEKSCSSGMLSKNGNACYKSEDLNQDGTPKSGKHPIKDAYIDGHWKPLNSANNGTALGANSSVQHNNSTAVGAGAKSTDTNQVTLGTKDETIRAEGITSQKSKNRQQGAVEVVTSDSGGRLATDGGQIFSTLSTHNDQINDLYNLNAAQQNSLNAHTALLSEHTKRLDEQEKGLAIAMALPDAWLSDKKHFGVFGSVGGFGGETAIGFAAIGRLNETWSVNGKLGADMDFDQLGWQVGFGAQW